VLFFSPVWLLALAGLLALHARLDRRAAGQLPPGPGGIRRDTQASVTGRNQ
jgi:hypothetical protein